MKIQISAHDLELLSKLKMLTKLTYKGLADIQIANAISKFKNLEFLDMEVDYKENINAEDREAMDILRKLIVEYNSVSNNRKHLNGLPLYFKQ